MANYEFFENYELEFHYLKSILEDARFVVEEIITNLELNFYNEEIEYNKEALNSYENALFYFDSIKAYIEQSILVADEIEY